METEILKADTNSIEKASSLLQKGEVVALPTETVYGLAGDATNGSAIKKIFEAKGRPMDNPLIVHISSFSMLEGLVSEVNDDARKLMENFWPGPLTIIMPKGEKVCDEVCAGLSSVGVRMPANFVAREVIEKSGILFAAPSANTSGKPSPTTADDVYEDMKGKIPLILDGGECEKGVESTVVSVLDDVPVILRPGVITKEMMEKVLGKEVLISKAITEEVKNEEKVLSPGMKYKHYSPKAEVIIVKGDFEKFRKFVEEDKSEKAYALLFDEEKVSIPFLSYGHKNKPEEQAHFLFSRLRELDRLGAKKVYARCPDKTGVALAVYNRLVRSAGFKIIEL